MRNVKVFERDLAEVTRSFKRARLSGKQEAEASRLMRAAFERVLRDVVEDNFDTSQGGIRSRSRNSYNIMRRGGVRVFGSTFNRLEGHIIGPGYIKLLEEGGTVEPKSSSKLAIPMAPHALRPDGTPKLPGPRSWQNVVRTFIYKSKRNGRSYIAYSQNGQLRLLYSLVDSSEFEGGFRMLRSWDRRSPALLTEFGNIMLQKMSEINLMKLARLTVGGRR